MNQVKIQKWKAVSAPMRVAVQNEKDETAPGTVYLQTWDQAGRTKRATKALAVIWGVGAFCILFPIIHFVLPPLLLVAGPLIAFKLSQQKSAVLGGVGTCPSCKNEFEIVRGNYLMPEDRWPLTDLCSNCRADLKILRASEVVV